MPDWTDLSPQDVNAILDWLAVDGPDQKPADERDAELATAADITRARALFDGRTPLADGGLACAACHTVRDHGRRVGGTLGPDLTDTYLRYRDRALTLVLRHPCTPRQPELGSGRYLRARGSVRAEGLPAGRGARRLALRHLPDRRSEARTTMNETTGSFLFRGWPYLALVLAAAGFVIRLLLTGDRVPALRRATPRARAVFVGGRPWIAAWLLLAAGHVAGLLFPRAVLAWTRTPWHVVALEAAGFAIGLGGAGGLRPRRRGCTCAGRRASGWSLAADFADSVFLSFLFIAVASGLLAATVHRWGSQWAAVTMAPYAASLLHGRPVPAFVEHLPFVVRLHLFASFAAIACLPATRLAVLPLALAHRALAVAGPR